MPRKKIRAKKKVKKKNLCRRKVQLWPLFWIYKICQCLLKIILIQNILGALPQALLYLGLSCINWEFEGVVEWVERGGSWTYSATSPRLFLWRGLPLCSSWRYFLRRDNREGWSQNRACSRCPSCLYKKARVLPPGKIRWVSFVLWQSRVRIEIWEIKWVCFCSCQCNRCKWYSCQDVGICRWVCFQIYWRRS